MTSPAKHLPECKTHTLAEMYPDEPKPEHLSDYSWYELLFEECADDCPVMARTLERGRQLAEEHGW